MLNPYKFSIGILIAAFLMQCAPTADKSPELGDDQLSKPFARYWWFASEIQEDDVRYNLDWLKSHGFGGVELAFVYPLNSYPVLLDSSYTPRQEWQSDELKSIVEYTVQYADSIGMACDLTFGTLWPFGDSKVSFEQATQRFGDEKWRQDITRSWENPKSVYVIDHITPKNYLSYFERMVNFLPKVATTQPQAYFIDSWEVETHKLWSSSFASDFQEAFGYDIVPYMDSIYEPGYSDYLYDYSSLLSDKVIQFYADFDSTLNANGVASRGQVSGAPCDLISGYALMDIPESEAMLFEPEFSSIPASAALLSGKDIVSSEAFTCLYGWPRDYIRKEQTADLKLVADALFVNGVNKFIWHGKAHNPAGMDTVNFYASVHIGDDGNLAEEITDFNRYLQKISLHMQKGHTYSDIAVYLPTEDAWLKGIMPKEKQFLWAWGHYEMRYVYFPQELKSYNPSWINHKFLEKADFSNGTLNVGDASFKALYIDANYLDYGVLRRVSELASSGLKIILKSSPIEPGVEKLSDYDKLVSELLAYENVSEELPDNLEVFMEGDAIPEYWCREDGETLYIFFASPKSKLLKFPIEYGQSLNTDTETFKVKVNYKNQQYPLDLVFRPYQSLLYKIENGTVQPIDIQFVPKTPKVIERPADYKAPWLIE